MKIAQVVHGFPPELASGGTERYTQALCQHLTERGHELVVIAGTLEMRSEIDIEDDHSHGFRVLRLHRDDIYFERWDKSWHPGVSKRFAEIIETERPDIVHVQHWFRLSRDLIRQVNRLGIPAIATLHDFFSTCPTAFRLLPDHSFCTDPILPTTCNRCLAADFWWGEDELARGLQLYRDDFINEFELANRVLVLSGSHGRSLAQATGIDDSRFLSHPFRSWHKLSHAPQPSPPPPLRLATWGHQAPYKGSDLLLEAIARMRHRDDVTLDIFGDCSDAEFSTRLDELARGLAVTRHGAFESSDLESLECHLAIFPSKASETYGFVLDEAQMLGWPTLVSDLGAYPERIGGSGESFSPTDVQGLASRLDALLDDPTRLSAMREACQPPGQFEDNVDFLENLYQEVVKEGPPSSIDRFDVEGHLEHEYRRFEARERLALRHRGIIESREETDE